MLNRITSNTDAAGVPAITVGVPTITLGVPAITAGVSPSRTLCNKYLTYGIFDGYYIC